MSPYKIRQDFTDFSPPPYHPSVHVTRGSEECRDDVSGTRTDFYPNVDDGRVPEENLNSTLRTDAFHTKCLNAEGAKTLKI